MSEMGQTRSFGDVGFMSGLPESGRGWATYLAQWRAFYRGDKTNRLLRNRIDPPIEIGSACSLRQISWTACPDAGLMRGAALPHFEPLDRQSRNFRRVTDIALGDLDDVLRDHFR
jgi:hypothetical protein